MSTAFSIDASQETVGSESVANQGKEGHKSWPQIIFGKCTQPSVHSVNEAIHQSNLRKYSACPEKGTLGIYSDIDFLLTYS